MKNLGINHFMSALSNLKILDFCTLLPGPYATMILSDLGADVIHIESPSRPDLARTSPPFKDGVATAHSTLNRNKRSLSLDLKHPEAIGIVKSLVKTYDIIIEQFRPSVMERLGLGYDSLSVTNEKIIYCSLTGYGQTGPYRDRAGHDINYLSIAGVNGHSGKQGEKTPLMGVQIADLAGGALHSVIAILAAVNQRNVMGIGQFLDVSMTDGVFALNSLAGAAYLAGEQLARPESNPLNGGSFYDYYETKDGRYLSVGSLEPKFLIGLARILEEPKIQQLGMQHTLAEQKMMKAILTDTFLSKTLSEWQGIFEDEDVCVEPVLLFEEACEHPQLLARKMVTSIDTIEGCQQNQIASAFHLSQSPPTYKHGGVPLGHNNEQILQELNYDPKQIGELVSSGVFG